MKTAAPIKGGAQLRKEVSMKWKGPKPKPPSGTWGLAIQIAPKARGSEWPGGDEPAREIVAIAADWSDPESRVLILDKEGQWVETDWTTADFALVPERALAQALEQRSAALGGTRRGELRTRPTEIF